MWRTQISTFMNFFKFFCLTVIDFWKFKIFTCPCGFPGSRQADRYQLLHLHSASSGTTSLLFLVIFMCSGFPDFVRQIEVCPERRIIIRITRPVIVLCTITKIHRVTTGNPVLGEPITKSYNRYLLLKSFWKSFYLQKFLKKWFKGNHFGFFSLS